MSDSFGVRHSGDVSSDSLPHDSSYSPAEKRIRELVAEFERSLRRSFPKENDPKTLEQIEQLTEEIGESIKEKIQRDAIEQQGSGFIGSRTCCHFCRQSKAARYRGERSRQMVTLHGSVSVPRAYYHCADCKRGFCPLDRQFGIGPGQISAAVVSLLCRFCTYLSFREAARELAIVCNVHLSHSSIVRYASAVGQQLQQTHEERREQVRRALEAGDPSEQDKLCPAGLRPDRQQIAMDGVLIHAGGQWREVKLGCVYRPDCKDGARDARYFATLADSTRFGADVHTLAASSGLLKCRQVAVVADGAEWIWQETGKYFASRVQILDFYHATEHLWSVSRMWHGEKTEAERVAAKVWVGQQKERLLSGKAADVVSAIEGWQADTAEARDVKRRELSYFKQHLERGRLRYPEYMSAGFNIGSGMIEAGCKAVVQSRMKGAGMRWSKEGAEAMLHMRAAWCSQGGADFTVPARKAIEMAQN
jgi:hypothetical protein